MSSERGTGGNDDNTRDQPAPPGRDDEPDDTPENRPPDPLQQELENRLAAAIERAYSKNKRTKQRASDETKPGLFQRMTKKLHFSKDSPHASLTRSQDGAVGVHSPVVHSDKETLVSPTSEEEEVEERGGEGSLEKSEEEEQSSESPARTPRWALWKKMSKSRQGEGSLQTELSESEQIALKALRPLPEKRKSSSTSRLLSLLRSPGRKQTKADDTNPLLAENEPSKTKGGAGQSGEEGGFEGEFDQAFLDKVRT